MSYNEVRGTGLAAVCPLIEEGSTNLTDLKPGTYKLKNLCLEPTKIQVGHINLESSMNCTRLRSSVHLCESFVGIGICQIWVIRYFLAGIGFSLTCAHSCIPQVQEEGLTKASGPQWSNTKLLTRQTTNLSDVSDSF